MPSLIKKDLLNKFSTNTHTRYEIICIKRKQYNCLVIVFDIHTIRIHMLLLPLISILLEVMRRYAGNDDIIFSLQIVDLHIHSTLFTNIE